MRKLLSAFAVGGAMLAATMAAGPASAKMELTYAPWTPAVVYANRVATKEIFADIEKATNGEIVWRSVPGGQLAGPRDSFQAASDGLADATFGIIIYNPSEIPSLNVIYSYLVFQGGAMEAGPAALETYTLDCPSCLAEFKAKNIVPLAGWTTSQYHLACTKPIKSVADLKGKRVRGTGGPAQLWELAGATPVSSTLPESVTLLQRGGLDCMHTVHSWLQTFGYGDYGKYITDFPLSLSGPAIGMMMNRDVWEKMTPDQRTVHLKAAAKFSAMIAVTDQTHDQQKYLEQVMKEKGVTLVEADKASFQKLVDEFESIQLTSITAAGQKFGVKAPEKILDAYAQNRAKWAKLVKGVDTNEAMEKLIWDEIYSKVDVNTF